MAAVTYCKRLRMEIDLQQIDGVLSLPTGFAWVPWDESTLQSRHAQSEMRMSFQGEIDSLVFKNLANFDGCLQLMFKRFAIAPGSCRRRHG